jgi:hypothetical protein
MQLKYLFIVSALSFLTLGVQASEKKIEKSPCIKELYKKIEWKLNSPTPELIDFPIQQKLEECQKLGDGNYTQQWDKIIDRAVNEKNKKVVEYAVIEKNKPAIISQASFSNTAWYFGVSTISLGLGYTLAKVLGK